MTELDFRNIQGFVVRGYCLPAAGYVFLRIDDGAKARAFLGDFIPHVITAEDWGATPDSGINVAFSFEGLRALGVNRVVIHAADAGSDEVLKRLLADPGEWPILHLNGGLVVFGWWRSRRFGPLEVSGSVNPAAGTHFARQSNLDVKTGDPIPA